MLDKISDRLNKLFNNHKVLSIIKYYNIVILIIYVLGSFAYLFGVEFYKAIHGVLVALLGFNLFSLIPIGYIMSKFNFCQWSRMAYISNIMICLLKLLFSLLEVFKIHVPWDGIIMTVMSSILLTFTLKYLLWNKSLSS